jgi:hypothetical protein
MASELDKVAEKLQKEAWAGYTKTVIDYAQKACPMPTGKNSGKGPTGETRNGRKGIADGEDPQARP